MAYDASLPVNGSKVKAAELRGQFAGLKELIDSGTGITSVVVDSVTTVDPGEPATVTLAITGTVLHMSFAFPQGQPGVPGLQGPPFANIVIDSITTLDPGANAGVFVYFDGTLVHLSFAIPRGAQGEQGIQGPPGEVTNAALDAAIAGTSASTNGVGLLNLAVSDSPTPAELQAQMQAMANKLDELITALRR